MYNINPQNIKRPIGTKSKRDYSVLFPNLPTEVDVEELRFIVSMLWEQLKVEEYELLEVNYWCMVQ